MVEEDQEHQLFQELEEQDQLIQLQEVQLQELGAAVEDQMELEDQEVMGQQLQLTKHQQQEQAVGAAELIFFLAAEQLDLVEQVVEEQVVVLEEIVHQLQEQ